MVKEDVVCIYTMEYYLALKMNEILPFTTTWMGLESVTLSEISQKKTLPYYFTHMWNFRNKTSNHRWKKDRGKPRTDS